MSEPAKTQHERFHFEDAESFKQKIAALRLDIPFSGSIRPLFSPLRIAGLTVPNRLAIHPMEGADAEPDGAPGTLTFRRYKRFGAGGSGLIWFEAAAVTREGLSNPRQLRLTPENTSIFKRLVDETRSAAQARMGKDHHPMLILQLTHSGRYAKPEGKPQPIMAQRNPVLDAGAPAVSDDCVVSDEALDALQEAFVEAAERAAQAGFDGVDIKACHGYLAAELLSARQRENSRYGGGFENRTRFVREIIEKIRQRLPDLVVTSRISAFDGLPFPHGFGTDANLPGAADLSEPIALARLLLEAGCPLLNISVGIPYAHPHIGRPFNKPCINSPLPDEHPLTGVARMLKITGEMQRALPSLPMVGTGYSWLNRFFPNVGAGIMEQGRAAFIGLGRMAFAHPDFASILSRHGSLDPKNLCIGCSCCSELLRRGENAGCVVRDKETYAPLYKRCTSTR
ncbi:MAG: hypothetical protein ABIK28_11750 [Planctomycetota bacterium]